MLSLGLSLVWRQRVLRVKMSPHVVEIRDRVIQSILEKHFKEQFAELSIKIEVVCKKELEILLSTPLSHDKLPEAFLQRSEKEIGEILYRAMRYQKPFFITLSTS